MKNDWVDARSHPARLTDPRTSHAAAQSVQFKLGFVRHMVFTVFVAKYPDGASNEDIYRAYPMEREDTVRPRVAELKNEGFIEECGEVLGSKGRYISLWKLTSFGRQVAEHLDLALGVQTLIEKSTRKGQHAKEQPRQSLWLVGRDHDFSNEEESGWDLHGVFSTRQKAIDACLDHTYFIGSVELDTSLSDDRSLRPAREYPKGK